jgi:anaerobic ribonucleoside-triphosphate reductase
MKLVRKIAENYKLPYYTMSPTYSVCQDHGYIAGEVGNARSAAKRPKSTPVSPVTIARSKTGTMAR